MKILSGSMVTVHTGDSNNSDNEEEEQMRPQITEVIKVKSEPRKKEKKGTGKNEKLVQNKSCKKNIVKVDLIIKNRKQNVYGFLNKAQSMGIYNPYGG